MAKPNANSTVVPVPPESVLKFTFLFNLPEKMCSTGKSGSTGNPIPVVLIVLGQKKRKTRHFSL